MASMHALASHILAVAHRSGQKISNLQLQKIMFFSIGFYVRNHGIDKLIKNTYDAPFEKWRYGPVAEYIYYAYSHYGANKIDEEGLYSSEYSAMDETITKLINVDVFKLVNVSHQLSSWKNYEHEIEKRIPVSAYSLKEIEKDFSDNA